LVFPEGAWSGDELLRRAGRAATWLAEIGAPVDTPVPAVLESSPDACALALGAMFSGRALAPLGSRLPPDELAHAVRGLGSPILVSDRAHVEPARAAADRAEVRVHLVDRELERGERLEDRSTPGGVGAVIHTSGTTGRPHPVLQRHAQLVARVRIYSRAIELGAGDRYCSASPFYHVAGMGMVLIALGAGATVIPLPAFGVAAWRALRVLEPSHGLLVPTMIDMLLAEGALDIGLRVLQYGGAPIHRDVLAEAMAAAPATRLIQIFGQTEVSPITALSHDDHVRARRGATHLLESVGRACEEVTLAIDDPDDNGIGELLVRAPHVFEHDAAGVRATGDLGRVDDDGYVYLRGRRHDRIVRGGENVYPVEIENVIALHPAVADVCVVGIPDRRWGELVKAVVVVRDDAPPPSVAAIQEHVREHLAHFKVPTQVEFVDVLPRTPTGKVLRRALG
jgi:acyl-CoA synthetase (AMP-forming)/AMP-acid ligase II